MMESNPAHGVLKQLEMHAGSMDLAHICPSIVQLQAIVLCVGKLYIWYKQGIHAGHMSWHP